MSEIDYQAVAEQLQRECEQLRMSLFQARHTKHSLVDGPAMRAFVIKHYVVISASILILLAVFSFVDTVRSFLPRSKE